MSQQEIPSMKPSRNLDEINARLTDLRKRNFNLIGPGIRTLTKMETLPDSFEVAWHGKLFDPTIPGPHVYSDRRFQGGLVALKREALLELWMSADGKFVSSAREDDGKDPHYARYTWAGSVLSLSGVPMLECKTKELDLRAGSEQTKAMKDGQTSQQRSDISQLCESKAQNRVIRAMLGISHTYTPEQIARPFILMKLVFVPNMSDALTRLLVTATHLGAANALFGSSDFIRQLVSGKVESDEEELRTALPAKEETKQIAAPAKPVQSTEDAMLDFTAASPAQQAEILATTMKAKGFPESNLKKPLTEFKAKDRLDLFKHLLTLADAEEDAPAFSV